MDNNPGQSERAASAPPSSAGFPCHPFSNAGVSQQLSLGKKHGFEDKEQGNRCEQVLHNSYCLTFSP